jgi:hypothetical protein
VRERGGYVIRPYGIIIEFYAREVKPDFKLISGSGLKNEK